MGKPRQNSTISYFTMFGVYRTPEIYDKNLGFRARFRNTKKGVEWCDNGAFQNSRESLLIDRIAAYDSMSPSRSPAARNNKNTNKTRHHSNASSRPAHRTDDEFSLEEIIKSPTSAHNIDSWRKKSCETQGRSKKNRSDFDLTRTN